MPTKPCAQCGREFTKSREHSYAIWATIRYCSNTCKGFAARKKRVCECCEETFQGRNGRARQPYCSLACYWLSLRTERYPVRNRRRGQEFSLPTRKVLIERAGGACETCGATEHLEFDHGIPCHAGGTNDETNGQVLCRHCHRIKTARETRALFAL